jgi:sarcosine oxidase
MRVVVVGCGAVGAASALALTRAGHEVTIVERIGPANTYASSHGHARIFRCAYDIPDYAELAVRALERWRAVEAETGETLLTTTGCVDHGDAAALEQVLEATTAAGAQSIRVPRAEARERWPGLRFESDALLDPTGGRLDAARAVLAMTRLSGARLVPERATEIAAGSVSTAAQRIEADAVVVAAGAWTTKLVPGLPEQVVSVEQPVHLATERDDWPAFIHHESPFVYGLYEPGAGLKVGEHATGREQDPDDLDRTPDPDRTERLREYCARWLPGADASTAVATGCLYDTTETDDFVIDRAPSGVVVACGTSGHGFKFAPELGHLVARLVDGAAPHPRFAL